MIQKIFLNIVYAQGQGYAPRGGYGYAPGGSVEFLNPLGTYDISQILDRIINGLLIIATPILVVMILWAAFLFMTSAGNPAKVDQARKTIIWAAVGYGVLLVAKGVSFIVEQLLR